MTRAGSAAEGSGGSAETVDQTGGGFEARVGHNVTCDALDVPGTSVVMVNLSPSPEAIVAALDEVFDPAARWAPAGVEALVMIPASAPLDVEARVFAALRRTEGLVSYRGEPFERTSLVRSSSGDARADVDADVDAAVRMAAGADVIVWPVHATATALWDEGEGGSNSDESDEEEKASRSVTTPLPPPPDPIPRRQLLAAQGERCWRDGSGARQSPAHRSGDADVGDADVAMTFIVQYYRRPALVSRIVAGLAAGARAGLDWGERWEILVANDGGGGDDGAAWARALSKSAGTSGSWRVVHAGNLHEIRSYARLARLARGRAVAFMQDDDVPPRHGHWIRQSLALFRKHPRLALLGGYTGKTAGGPRCGKYGLDAKGVYAGRDRLRMPTSDTGGPFMFHAQLNMGPFILRTDALRHMGGLQLGFSCRGESGIGFDYELSLRVWYHGYEAGLINTGFEYRTGAAAASSGTRRSPGAYRARQRVERRNTGYKGEMYAGFHVVQGSPSEGMGAKCRELARKNPPVGCNLLVHEANMKLKGYGSGGGGTGGGKRQGGGRSGRGPSGEAAEAAAALATRRKAVTSRLAKAAKGARAGEKGRLGLEAALREAEAARVSCFATAGAVDAATPGPGEGGGGVARVAGCDAYEGILEDFALARRREQN